MKKNLYRSITRSIGRYLAIVAIIALGSAMFVGLLMTKSEMVATGQQYMQQQNLFDLRLISTYGWDLEDVQTVSQLDGIENIEGQIYLDALVQAGDSAEESVYRIYAMPEVIDLVDLRGGRLPEADNECLADGYQADDSILGTTVTVTASNSQDTLDSLVYTTYTVVGYVASPLYMDMSRGTTSVGSGSISSFLYVPREALDFDYYTEIHVTIPGEYDIYSDDYNNALSAAAEALKPQLIPIAQTRLDRLRSEAQEAYEEGLAAYEDGCAQLADARDQASRELTAAYDQLIEAENQISQSESTLNAAQSELDAAQEELAQGEETLKESREALDTAKAAAYAPLDSSQEALDAQIRQISEKIDGLQEQIDQIDAQLASVNSEIARIESNYAEQLAQKESLESDLDRLNSSIRTLETALQATKLLPGDNSQLIAQLETTLAEQTAQRDSLQSQLEQLQSQLTSYYQQIEAPQAQQAELRSQRQELSSQLQAQQLALNTATLGQTELDNARALLDEQFSETETQLEEAEAQLQAGKEQIEQGQQEINDGRQQLSAARQTLAAGWTEYYDGKATAEAELRSAQQELDDAHELLLDAEDRIAAMQTPTIHILDCNTNVGYSSLDSSSDIVAGVSRVFPAFFLLVAALVCITTMTRMIEEERTQIGTLKALGYSNAAIICKYLIYAGSGAIIGCGLGVTVGSAVFPTILWEAYKIMLYITDDIVLQFNWKLCILVVAAYTLLMLLVTWYCCRRTLREEPAELIRPRAPDAGKKILLERFPIWQKISFLNKVTIRNIFRYRQRLAMMILGIGGCTALLLTGYGLRDSITNVVDYQFQEVTVYDMTVYFNSARTSDQQTRFRQKILSSAEDVLFYHQSSIELDFNNQTKEIYLISADDDLAEYIDFHRNSTQLELPGMGEMLLSAGAAEAMNISVGDQVQLRNADMQILELTVSGIYDNHVYNYAIVSPETVQAQWGQYPEQQMAFIRAREDTDIHALAAQISGLEGVMNVSVSADLADMVGSMMDALDLVVWVIVFCAGLLAAIVLYNLTNININERIREIATVKVLGFNSGETAAYVFKENLSLSALGSVCGLGLGYLLLLFVMSQIKIDMVWFKVLLEPVSCLLALAFTMLAACIVDFIFYFKLERINMAEALKSVE